MRGTHTICTYNTVEYCTSIEAWAYRHNRNNLRIFFHSFFFIIVVSPKPLKFKKHDVLYSTVLYCAVDSQNNLLNLPLVFYQFLRNCWSSTVFFYRLRNVAAEPKFPTARPVRKWKVNFSKPSFWLWRRCVAEHKEFPLEFNCEKANCACSDLGQELS